MLLLLTLLEGHFWIKVGQENIAGVFTKHSNKKQNLITPSTLPFRIYASQAPTLPHVYFHLLLHPQLSVVSAEVSGASEQSMSPSPSASIAEAGGHRYVMCWPQSYEQLSPL